MKKNTKNEIEVFITIFLAFPILAGLLSSADFSSTETLIAFYWQIVLFAILLGSLMVNIKIKHLEESDQESFPRLGFSTIIAGILVLIGNGIFALSLRLTDNAQKILYILGQVFNLSGTFFLAVCVSALLIIAGRTIIDLKK